MSPFVHEIRDPIHAFIRLDSDERRVLDSRPLQRLRHIHQLATTWLVYPGATHRRFEHSLGVMELAGRVYDVVTDTRNVSDDMRRVLEPLSDPASRVYWRRAVRMAALCHDIGHLPFSHAAEKELLPEGWDHERLTRCLVSSREMNDIWKSMKPPLVDTDILKLAVGPDKAEDMEFTNWEELMAEIIVGDAFGVDRMDYLLRDSHHAGVAYGQFDRYRLIDTLRILPAVQEGKKTDFRKPTMGMEEGGIQSAEALALARYFMYSQVYFHHVRRMYDIHLKDFLNVSLPGGRFPTDTERHLQTTDSGIADALWRAAFDKDRAGHIHARRIVRREHFQLVYQRNSEDIKINPEPGASAYKKLAEEYGVESVRHDFYKQANRVANFPVRLRNGAIISSLGMSEALRNVPAVTIDRIFADRGIAARARDRVDRDRAELIKPEKEEDDG